MDQQSPPPLSLASTAPNALAVASQGLPIVVVDAFNLWPSLCIAKSIPLGRMEWHWTNRGTTTREHSLHGRAVFRMLDNQSITEPALTPKADEWFLRAYVHLLLVPIEELTSQRESPAWQYVRKFVEQCREKRFEYIVGVIADSETARQNKRTMDRVKESVNIKHRERVVNIPQLTLNRNQKLIEHLYHSPPHQELLIRIRECTRDEVEVRVQRYESELERLYPKRASPDWSFCYFFTVKEAMGYVFCHLARRDVYLRLLDELYIFMLEYGEKDARDFCNQKPCEAAKDSSTTAAKDYPKLFSDNTITEMEMRSYIFARQTEVLLIDKKYSEIAERGLKLITAVSRRCIEEATKIGTPPASCFRDAWVFTAARDLAATLAPAIPAQTQDTNSMSPQLTNPKARHTARLIAGFHVHALKAFVGLAKVILPGTMAVVRESDSKISDTDKNDIFDELNDELCAALTSASHAEDMYSEIANAAASLYEMGGRSRGAAALDGDAGVIRLRNGSLSEAEKLLSAQCSRFSEDHSWDDLHLEKRKELAHAEKALNKTQEYLVSCLTILFMTRASRKISSHANRSDEQIAGEAELAAKWAKETYNTACKLPRVMKYRAEKLFNVYMRPGLKNWSEGDPGKAIVAIDSDIPAEVRIDSLFVELRSSLFPAEKKSASDKGRDKEPKLGTLTMKSKPEKIYIRPGLNEVPVFASEIQWPGRYVATLVALFVGKLKLVQIAPKPESYPIVGIKGSSSQRTNLAKVTNAGQQPDIGKAWVKFPAFFAQKRAVPATVNIVEGETLYLVQGSIQTVDFRINSVLHGMDTDATLNIKVTFVTDNESETKSSEETAKQTPILQVINISGDDGVQNSIPFESEPTAPDSLKITLKKSVKEGCTVVSKVSIVLPNRVCSNGVENKSADCSIEASLSGREMSSSARRSFTCKTEKMISFLNPLTCDSRADTRAKSVTVHGSPDSLVGQGVDGGMLLCTVQSTIPNKKITLQNATLELPHWLKFRDETRQPHEDLLPIAIHERTKFVFAFDVLVSGTPVIEDDIARKALSGFTRRYSRRSNSERGDDDGPDESPMRAEGLSHVPSASEINGLDTSRSADLELAVQQDSEGYAPMEGVTEDVEMTYDEDEPRTEAPEIGEVVDLSGAQGEPGDKQVTFAETMPCREEYCGRLRLDFNIEGVEGIAHVERVVHLKEFRPQRRTYRIERSFPRVISSGKLVTFVFNVSLVRNPNFADGSSDSTEELIYDINVKKDWIVSGRKRGTIALKDGNSGLQKVDLLPLSCGYVLMPIIELYSLDGRILPENSFENINESLQVNVLPSTHVTSICKQKGGDAAESAVKLAAVNPPGETQATSPKANMPQVVTFDSFFDRQ